MNKYDALFTALNLDLRDTYDAEPEAYNVPIEFTDIFNAGLKYQQARMMLLTCDSLTEFEKRDRPQYDKAVTMVNEVLGEEVTEPYRSIKEGVYVRLPASKMSVDTTKNEGSFSMIKFV